MSRLLMILALGASTLTGCVTEMTDSDGDVAEEAEAAVSHEHVARGLALALGSEPGEHAWRAPSDAEVDAFASRLRPELERWASSRGLPVRTVSTSNRRMPIWQDGQRRSISKEEALANVFSAIAYRPLYNGCNDEYCRRAGSIASRIIRDFDGIPEHTWRLVLGRARALKGRTLEASGSNGIRATFGDGYAEPLTLRAWIARGPCMTLWNSSCSSI
jgi:hypothetical protein